MTSAASARWRREVLLLVVTIATAGLVQVCAQTLNVHVAAGLLHIDVSGFRFITGPVLDRLRDGRSVRLDFDMAVLPRPKEAAIARSRQSFNLSFDIWEERVAITHVDVPDGSISHLRPADAEAWCLERLALPLATLGRFGRGEPFWIRLQYRVPDDLSARDQRGDGFSLQRLIDRLSGRQSGDIVQREFEAGPFRAAAH